MRCNLELPALFIEKVQVGLGKNHCRHRCTHSGGAPWVKFRLGAIKVLPFWQAKRCVSSGNQFVVATPLNFPEQYIGVGNRTERIEYDAGCRVWGGFFDTVDVDMDRTVMLTIRFGCCRYFF